MNASNGADSPVRSNSRSRWTEESACRAEKSACRAASVDCDSSIATKGNALPRVRRRWGRSVSPRSEIGGGPSIIPAKDRDGTRSVHADARRERDNSVECDKGLHPPAHAEKLEQFAGTSHQATAPRREIGRMHRRQVGHGFDANLKKRVNLARVARCKLCRDDKILDSISCHVGVSNALGV